MHVADRLGWTVLSTRPDPQRTRRAGTGRKRCRGAGWRSPESTQPSWTERTYAELFRRAALLLGDGESVIADASFGSAAQRAAAAAVAARTSADLVQLRCTAPPELIRERVRSRPHYGSDADSAIAARMAASFEPWPAVTDVSTFGPAAVTSSVEQALAAVRPHGPEHVWRPARPVMLPG